MIRWTYIFPRLMILGLLGLAVWIGSDLIVKNTIIKSIENTTGAKVEVAQIRTALAKGKVFLKDIRVADPRDPMRNLFQAELAYVELDLERLKHREFRVREGKASNVQFGAPRTSSGFLRTVDAPKPTEPGVLRTEFTKRELERTWLDSLGSTSTQISHNDLVTEEIAHKILGQWESQIANLHVELKELAAEREGTVSTVAQGIGVSPNSDPANPLRRDRQKQAQFASVKVQKIQNRIRKLFDTYQSLEEQKSRDLKQLLDAVEMDSQHLEKLVVPASFDSDKINKLLLADIEREYTEQVLEWYRWFRSAIPEPETDFNPVARRGHDVTFGTERASEFLIEQLDFEGQGRIGGQHVDFSGFVKNLATQPKLLEQPTSFHLRAQGDQPFLVDCTLDRRGETLFDTIQVTCTGLPGNLDKLGTPNSLIVSVLGDQKLDVTAKLYVDGENIRGTIDFRHSDLQLYVERVHALAGGNEAVLRMNQDFIPTINQFKTQVALSGTIDNPTYEFESGLGQTFAEALSAASQHKIKQQQQALQQQINQKNKAIFEEVDSKLNGYLQKIAAELNGEKAGFVLLRDKVAELKESDDKLRR